MAQTLLNDCSGSESVLVDVDEAPATDAQLTTAISREFANRLAVGYLHDGRRVQIDDGSRANLTGVAVTAMFALQGTLPWPDDYARGWISIEGDRLALPTPESGIALAYGAATYYSALVQHERDLLGLVIAGQDVDPSAGWPE